MNAEALREAPQHVDMVDVVQALFHLPSQQLVQVYDFILFLQGRYGESVDESDVWSDEDLRELSEASLAYIGAMTQDNDQDEY